jgi:hypothetical protein
LGILPGGTGNLLARNLGTIDLLDVELGRETRAIAVMCGAGFDAEMMAAPEARKRRLGWGAYAIEGARSLRSKQMDLRTPGARLDVRVRPAPVVRVPPSLSRRCRSSARPYRRRRTPHQDDETRQRRSDRASPNRNRRPASFPETGNLDT